MPINEIDHSFSILCFGGKEVGKTAISFVLQGHSFIPIQFSTYCLEYYKKIHIIRGKKIRTEIIDSPYIESHIGECVVCSQARRVKGIIFIYSVDKRSSFKAIAKINNPKSFTKEESVRILIGNRCDCAPEEREVSYEEGKKLAEKLEMKFFETSAKYNINIKEVFMYLTKKIYKNSVSKVPKKNFPTQDYQKQNKCYK